MKVTFLEPLGISQDQLKDMVQKELGDRVETVFYDTRIEDVPGLIERSRDADCVVLSNFKYGREVISQCPDLKMICVAFTGVNHGVQLRRLFHRGSGRSGIRFCGQSGQKHHSLRQGRQKRRDESRSGGI